jgi:hypothetical protein
MQSSTETRTIKQVTLVLDADEAKWLNGIMQNPLHGQNPIDEDDKDAEMRLKFFTATQPY